MTRRIVKVFGSDNEIFLQNLITNNLNLCTKENPIYSCLLSPKGRYQFDFFVIRIDDYFLIDISKNQVNAFISALKYRKLISKVNFEILEDYKVYNTKYIVDDSIVSYKDPRLDVLGYRTISTNEISLDNIMLNYNELRYKNAIPEDTDFTFDKSIPIEFGMDELGALIYNKGCYLGQEFTNSAKNRMAIRRRLVSVSANFILNNGDILTNHEGIEVGKIISVFNNDIVNNNTNLEGSGIYSSAPTTSTSKTTALALFKMPYKNEDILINGEIITKHIPSWIKVYSME